MDGPGGLWTCPKLALDMAKGVSYGGKPEGESNQRG